MLVKLATTCLLDLASVSRMECLVEHGDPSPALELCRTAHVLLRAYSGDVGAEYTVTGRAYLYAGMIMDAIRLFNAAFEVAAQAGGGSPDDPRVVASSLDLADAFLCDERYADALALYASAEPFLAAAMERSVLAGGAPEMDGVGGKKAGGKGGKKAGKKAAPALQSISASSGGGRRGAGRGGRGGGKMSEKERTEAHRVKRNASHYAASALASL